MIDQLMRLADELEARLREMISSTNIASWVIGAGIDIDPYWEKAEMLDQFNRRFNRYRDYDYYRDFGFSRGFQYDRPSGYFDALRALLRANGHEADLEYRPEDWNDHCRFSGYPAEASPVLFKVYLNDNMAGERLPELPLVLGEGYPVRYEFRKIPTATAGVTSKPVSNARKPVGGKDYKKGITLVREGTDNTGTLGGILRGRRSGDIYLVTCGHVAGGQDSHVSARSKKITQRLGPVAFSVMPPPMENNPQCSSTDMPGQRSIDLSLIKISCSLDGLAKFGVIPKVHSILSERQLRTDNPVFFVGKESGLVEARVGSLEIWHQVRIEGILYCYRKLVELKTVDDYQYVVKNLARPGDSGSWVLDNLDGSNRWVGMVVASERPRAFMCLAETILYHCDKFEPLVGVGLESSLQ